MSNKQELANRVRMARELAGLSQGQVAKRMNVHRPTISEIEAGRRNLKAEEIEYFANLYGVDMKWLISGEVSEEKLSSGVLAAARELNSMSPEDLDLLMETIKIIKSKGTHVKNQG